MESSIFRDLDGIVDSILSPYHTLEEVLPSGCDSVLFEGGLSGDGLSG